MNESWSEVHGSPYPNESAKSFIKILGIQINKSTGVTTVQNLHETLKPWISTGIITAIKRKNQLRRSTLNLRNLEPN